MYRKMYSQYIIVHTKYSSIPKNVLMKNYKTVFWISTFIWSLDPPPLSYFNEKYMNLFL